MDIAAKQLHASDSLATVGLVAKQLYSRTQANAVLLNNSSTTADITAEQLYMQVKRTIPKVGIHSFRHRRGGAVSVRGPSLPSSLHVCT